MSSGTKARQSEPASLCLCHEGNLPDAGLRDIEVVFDNWIDFDDEFFDHGSD
jgi:hypothetical protein